MRSPYRPGLGSRPTVLAGRESLLRRSTRVLDSIGTNEATGGAAIFVGPPGVGKTVLLKEISSNAEHSGFLTCWLACDGVSDNIHTLAFRTAESLQTLTSAKGFSDNMIYRLKNLSVEFSVYGLVKVASEAPKAEERPISRRQELLEVLESAADIAVRHNKRGLAIFVDEYHDFPPVERVVFESAIHDLFHRNSKMPLAVFGAGLQSAADFSSNSYGERFDFQAVARLTNSEGELALTGPARDLGVEWDAEAKELCINAAAGWPYLIQRIGDEAWMITRPEEGSVIAVDQAQRAIREVWIAMGAGMFRSRWANSTEAEQDFMLALASVAGSDGVAQLNQVFRLVGNAKWRMRSALMDRGIIESAGRGLVQFTVPGFAGYVLAQGADDLPNATPAIGDSTATPALEP